MQSFYFYFIVSKARYSWRIYRTGKIMCSKPENKSENVNQILTRAQSYFADFLLVLNWAQRYQYILLAWCYVSQNEILF